MAIFDNISVNLQLAMGRKSVDEVLDDAIQHDSAGTLAVVIKKPEVQSRLDALLELVDQEGQRQVF